MLAALVVRASKGVEGQKYIVLEGPNHKLWKRKLGRGTSVLVVLPLGGAPAFW